MVSWLGIAGPILSEASAKGVYKFMKDWQTLIGVAGAFVVGYIAVLPVWRQAAGAAIIPLVKTAETLEAERKTVFAARMADERVPQLVDDYNNEDPHRIYKTWSNEVVALQQKLDSSRQQIQEHTDRHPDTGREIDGLRRATLLWMKRLHDALGVLNHAFRQQTSGLDYEEGEEDLSDDVVKNAGTNVIDCLEGFQQFAWQLENSLGEEIPKIWARIRDLERTAIG